MPSHYTRKDTTKLYLYPDLNIRKMYELYKTDYCVKKKKNPVSEFVYRNVFNSLDPPLAFHQPRKDICTICRKYTESTEGEKLNQEDTWKQHIEQKELAFLCKKNDIATSNTEKNSNFCSFDLQVRNWFCKYFIFTYLYYFHCFVLNRLCSEFHGPETRKSTTKGSYLCIILQFTITEKTVIASYGTRPMVLRVHPKSVLVCCSIFKVYLLIFVLLQHIPIRAAAKTATNLLLAWCYYAVQKFERKLKKFASLKLTILVLQPNSQTWARDTIALF